MGLSAPPRDAAHTPISGVSLGVAKSSSATSAGRSSRVDNTSTWGDTAGETAVAVELGAVTQPSVGEWAWPRRPPGVFNSEEATPLLHVCV